MKAALCFGLCLAFGAACAPTIRDREAPPLDDVITLYNRRVELLQRLATRGSLEFRWVDEDGDRHFEPGVEARLWLDLPARVAMRARKIEDLFWIGCDGDRYWIFDMMGEETTLLVNAHGTAIGQGAAMLMRPRSLVDLAGLSPIPDTARAGAVWDAAYGAWRVAFGSHGDSTRLWIDRYGHAIAAETGSAGGAAHFVSAIGRYSSVPVRGVSKAALPKFPTLIDVSSPDGSFEIRLGLDVPDPDPNPVPFERVFDLDRLMQSLRPAHVTGDRAPS